MFLRVIGRLKPGVDMAEAQGQLDSLAADLRRRFAIKQTAGVYLRMEPMHDTLVSDVRPAILALMGAVAFVLLIACANVANLLLAQASRREQDLAVRTALGASPGSLVRQLLAECLLLSAIGAAAGLALAHGGVLLLQRIGPATLPRLASVGIDVSVLAFTLTVALTAVLLFGLVPALRASRPNIVAILRKSSRTIGLGAGRLRSGLVVVEVALSFVLLVGCGLMLRSMIALERVNPGFDPKRCSRSRCRTCARRAPTGGTRSSSRCVANWRRCPACRRSPPRTRCRSMAASPTSLGGRRAWNRPRSSRP